MAIQTIQDQILDFYNQENHSHLKIADVEVAAPWLVDIIGTVTTELGTNNDPAAVKAAYDAAYQAKSIQDHGPMSPFSA